MLFVFLHRSLAQHGTADFRPPFKTQVNARPLFQAGDKSPGARPLQVNGDPLGQVYGDLAPLFFVHVSPRYIHNANVLSLSPAYSRPTLTRTIWRTWPTKPRVNKPASLALNFLYWSRPFASAMAPERQRSQPSTVRMRRLGWRTNPSFSPQPSPTGG